VGRIPEHLRGDTIKSTSHCLFKVISGLVALLCNDLLYIFARVTRHSGHVVFKMIILSAQLDEYFLLYALWYADVDHVLTES
jgi:hypothetical protein